MRIAFVLSALLLGSQDPPSVGSLLEDLRSDSVERRGKAELELTLRGEVAIPVVEPLVAGGDAELAARARTILDGIARLRSVTPSLEKAVPGTRRRLAAARPRGWTEVFLEVADAVGVTRDDLDALAPLAVRGAQHADRIGVCRVVAASRLKTAVPDLVPWLDDPEWQVRERLFEALVACRARELGPVLLERLRRERPESRSTWFGLMADLGCREVIPDLVAQLLSPSDRFAGGSVPGLLAKLDATEAVPALLRMLREFSEPHALLDALERIAPDQVLPALAALLDDPDEEVRSRALNAVSGYRLAPDVLPLLLKQMDAPDSAVRARALSAVARLGRAETLPRIKDRLEDSSAAVRRAAALALASLGHRDGLPELLLMLRNPGHRISSAYALARLDAKDAVPDLVALLGEEEGKHHIAEALALLGAPAARPHLLGLVTNRDPEVRSSTAFSLVVLDGARAIPSLRTLMADSDNNVRWQAFHQLRLLAPEDSLPIVRAWAGHEDPHDRTQAYWHLSTLSPREAIPLLLREVDHPEGHSAASAMDCLGRLNATQAIPRLRAIHASPPSAHARRAAATALAWMGGRDGAGELLHSAEHPHQQLVLNALRDPEAWRAWRSRILAGGPLVGRGRGLVEALARRAGIAVDWPDAAREPGHASETTLKVDGRDLLSVFHEIHWTLPAAVLEADRVRFLPPRAARRFWLDWWAGECLKSEREDDRAEGRLVRRELEESEARLRELDRKRAAPAEPAALTPDLRAIPGLEERLARGGDEAWTRAFLEGVPSLPRADLDALAFRAIRGAMKPDELTRVLQTCALRRLGAARPDAERLFAHAAATVRVEAARLVLALDGAPSLPKVVSLFDDPDGQVRGGLVRVLGDLGLKEGVPEILARKEDPRVRSAIVDVAVALEIREALPIVLEFASRPGMDSYLVRRSACFALRGLGGPEINGEVRKLIRAETDPNALQALLGAAAEWGAREAVPEISDLVAKPRMMSALYQEDVFRALARLGAREAAPLILDRLRPERFQAGAAAAAAELGLAEALPPLRALLGSDRPEILASAAVALGGLGDRTSLGRLRELLRHSELPVRVGAAHGLALLRDRESHAAILEIARDPGNYSTEARRALALLRTPEALRQTATSLHHPDPRVLSAIARGGPELLPLLRPGLSSPDVWTRVGALQAVGRIEGDEALAELRRMAEHESPHVREAAGRLLCRRGLREGVPLALERPWGAYALPPLELNAVRQPEAWARLRSVRLDSGFRGPARELVARLSAASRLALEEIPKDSPELPAWTNVHVHVPEAETPLDGIEAVERLSSSRWSMILEKDRIRIVARREAERFWKEWREKEGR